MNEDNNQNVVSSQPSPIAVDDSAKAEQPVEQKKLNTGSAILIFVAVGLVLLVVMIIYLNMGATKGVFKSPDSSEYISYLENKYGADEQFSYVRDAECPMTEAGFCNKTFFSGVTGQEFDVKYSNNGGSKYSDDYWKIKYENNLNTYYRKKFSSVFTFNYSLSFEGEMDNQSASIASFNDLLNRDGFRLSITVNVGQSDSENMGGLDLESLQQGLERVVNDNEKPRISEVKLVLTISDGGSEEHRDYILYPSGRLNY